MNSYDALLFLTFFFLGAFTYWSASTIQERRWRARFHQLNGHLEKLLTDYRRRYPDTGESGNSYNIESQKPPSQRTPTQNSAT